MHDMQMYTFHITLSTCLLTNVYVLGKLIGMSSIQPLAELTKCHCMCIAHTHCKFIAD